MKSVSGILFSFRKKALYIKLKKQHIIIWIKLNIFENAENQFIYLIKTQKVVGLMLICLLENVKKI